MQELWRRRKSYFSISIGNVLSEKIRKHSSFSLKPPTSWIRKIIIIGGGPRTRTRNRIRYNVSNSNVLHSPLRFTPSSSVFFTQSILIPSKGLRGTVTHTPNLQTQIHLQHVHFSFLLRSLYLLSFRSANFIRFLLSLIFGSTLFPALLFCLRNHLPLFNALCGRFVQLESFNDVRLWEDTNGILRVEW